MDENVTHTEVPAGSAEEGSPTRGTAPNARASLEEAETCRTAAPCAAEPLIASGAAVEIGRRRTLLKSSFFNPVVSLRDYLAAEDDLRRAEEAVGYWSGTGMPPAPDPYTVASPDPERSYVHGLSETFATYYNQLPGSLRRRSHRCALLCVGGQAKLLQPLSQRNEAAWTAVHPDPCVTQRQKAALREDPVIRDLAVRIAPPAGRPRDDAAFHAELAARKVRVRTAPVEQTGLPAASYDLVVIDHAHLCLNLEPVYAEVRRLLRRGGMIIVTGHLPVLPGGVLDSLMWDLIGLLRPFANQHERALYRSFRNKTFPFHPVQLTRLREGLHDLPWTCTASWNLPTVAAQVMAWPPCQRLMRSQSDHCLALQDQLARIEMAWGRASTKRKVCIPVIAHAGLKLD